MRRYVEEIARRHVPKKAMDQAHAWGSLGHCDRIRALEKLEMVSYCVSRWGPSRSRLKVPEPNNGPRGAGEERTTPVSDN